MTTATPEFTPVNLITGFLGSGKTTLLKRLLLQPALADAAVLINEFGQIGLDHHLLERIDETMVLLPSGCLCCTIRGELADALRALHSRRERGEVPWFRRVVIESTGLADPFPIASTVHSDPVLRHHFRLGQIVTVVDAVHAESQFDAHEQSVRQAAVADQLVLSKTSLAGPLRTQALIARLRKLNPLAPLHDAERDPIDAGTLLCAGLFDLGAKSAQAQRWFAAERTPALWPDFAVPASPETETDTTTDTAPDTTHELDTGRYLTRVMAAPPGSSRHADEWVAFSVTLDAPLDWTRFGIWLTALVHRHGQNILRIKGLLNVQGSDTPVALHGVQQLIHAPEHLAAWPDESRASRLVFIARGLEPLRVQRSLGAFLGVGVGGGVGVGVDGRPVAAQAVAVPASVSR